MTLEERLNNVKEYYLGKLEGARNMYSYTKDIGGFFSTSSKYVVMMIKYHRLIDEVNEELKEVQDV